MCDAASICISIEFRISQNIGIAPIFNYCSFKIDWKLKWAENLHLIWKNGVYRMCCAACNYNNIIDLIMDLCVIVFIITFICFCRIMNLRRSIWARETAKLRTFISLYLERGGGQRERTFFSNIQQEHLAFIGSGGKILGNYWFICCQIAIS